MRCSNVLLFHQKSLDKDPILVKKSYEEGPISQKLQKKRRRRKKLLMKKKNFEKSAISEVEKPF